MTLNVIKKITIGFLILTPVRTSQIENLDKLFEQAIWEETKEVTVKEYEVEKITQTAGVRGNEAEHETLNYLYYRLNSKTNEIPSKLLELLLSDTNTH